MAELLFTGSEIRNGAAPPIAEEIARELAAGESVALVSWCMVESGPLGPNRQRWVALTDRRVLIFDVTTKCFVTGFPIEELRLEGGNRRRCLIRSTGSSRRYRIDAGSALANVMLWSNLQLVVRELNS